MAGSIVYQASGVQVRHSHLDPGKEIPWHRHSTVADLVFAVRGPVSVQVGAPDRKIVLQTGQSHHVDAGQPHRILNESNDRVEFLLVQGVGEHDFQVLSTDADLSSVNL